MIQFTIKAGTKTVIQAQETTTPGTWEILDETAIIEYGSQGVDSVSPAATLADEPPDVPLISSESAGGAQFRALNADIARGVVHNSDPDTTNFPPLQDDHARDPDWVDRHSGNPADIPDERALNLKSGGGNIADANDSFQSLEREELQNSYTPQRRYLFGFYRSLTLPIRIYVKEHTNTPESFWQRAQVRLGWLGNDPTAEGYYQSKFIDPALSTNGEYFVDTVRTEVQPGHTLERIEITDADLPATVNKTQIHWLEIQGLNFPADAPSVTTANGSEIWFKVCAAQGAPLPLKGKVNVTFLLDYNEEVASDQAKKDALKNTISAAVAEFNNLSTLYGDSSLFRFSLRVTGAIGAGRDLTYDAPEFKSYAEEDSTLMFTNTQAAIAFGAANTADQVLTQCNTIIDDATIRPAYSPLWRGISETLQDFDEARGMTRSAAGWVEGSSTDPDPSLKDTNLLLIFSQGKETVGGLIQDNGDPTPDVTIAGRREAAYEACRKLVFDASVESEAIGNLSPDQKDLLSSMISMYTGKLVELTGEDLDLLLQAIQIFADHTSASAGNLPTFTKADTTLSTAAIAIWNEIIAAYYQRSIYDVAEKIKGSSEPAANTLEHNLWRLLYDFQIGGQSLALNAFSAEGFDENHPLSVLDAVSGDPASPLWMAEQIKQSIINKRWCHSTCRLAGS